MQITVSRRINIKGCEDYKILSFLTRNTQATLKTLNNTLLI